MRLVDCKWITCFPIIFFIFSREFLKDLCFTPELFGVPDAVCVHWVDIFARPDPGQLELTFRLFPNFEIMPGLPEKYKKIKYEKITRSKKALTESWRLSWAKKMIYWFLNYK